LRDAYVTPVYHEQTLGSCTIHAVAFAFAFAYQFSKQRQVTQDGFMPSRLFVYYNERFMQGTTNQDTGSTIRDSIKSINYQGVCCESLWPYDISQFAAKPTDQCYGDALNHPSLRYHRVKGNSHQLCAALNAGYPVILGISVYESFESDPVKQTGVIPMPKLEEKALGGHAIVLVGYDNQVKHWIFRNSWGIEWGDRGHGYLPFKYLGTKSNLASDFWVVEIIDRE